MMNKIKLASLMLCLSLFLNGCWDFQRIDNRAFVIGTGLDTAEDGLVEATFQIALPSALSLMGPGGKGPPVLVISTKGKNAADLLDKLQNRLSRKVSLGHRLIVIFGEQYARQGVTGIRDELLRSPYTRMSTFILTTHGATAKEVLQAPYQLEKIPVMGLMKMQSLEEDMSVKLDDFLAMLSLTTHEQSAHNIAVRLVPMSDGSGRIFDTDGIAVYRGVKLAGFLKEQQVVELSSMWGDLAKRMVTYKLGEKDMLGIEFLNSKTKVATRITENRPAIRLTMVFTCQVIENQSRLELTNRKDLRKAQLILAEQMQKNAQNTLHILQTKMKSDIFGFGKAIHRQHPKEWKTLRKNWESIYPDVPIETDVRVHLILQGRIQQPERT